MKPEELYKQLTRVLPWLAVVIAAGWMVWFPFVADDNDLFYHLAGGRLFAETGAIQSDSFSSFLTPPRPFIDYYWLFQVVVFRVFSLGGYEALLVLRAVLFTATAGLALFLLWSRAKQGASKLYLLAVFGLVVGNLLGRMANLRPHGFSYLLLAVTLVLLESSSRWAVLALPLVAAFWASLHGIEYPVFLVAIGAYFAEDFLKGVREKSFDRDRLFRLAVLALSPLAILGNPNGLRLLSVPFRFSALASTYVVELRPPGLEDVFTFSFSKAGVPLPTYLPLLVVTVLLVALRALWLRQIRLSHLLLVAGGAYLLSRGMRFACEFALLSVPLVSAQAPLEKAKLRPWLAAIASVVVLALPLASFFADRGPRPAYPLARRKLPAGAEAFLRRVDTGGKVLHSPRQGGYLAWELYPRYQITADIQTPFLFDEYDEFIAANLFYDPDAFALWVTKYQPEYLIVPEDARRFPELVAEYPQYQPIFFDEESVLYVDSGKHPQLAMQYALGPVDPFNISRHLGAASDPDQAALLRPIAEKMAEIDPRGLRVNALLFAARMGQGDLEGALRAAGEVAAGSPQLPGGYHMRAEALFAQGRYAEAAKDFKKAMALVPKDAVEPVKAKLGRCLAKLGDWSGAYEALSAGLEPFLQSVSSEDLELLSLAARNSGRQRESELFRRIAQRTSRAQGEAPSVQ